MRVVNHWFTLNVNTALRNGAVAALVSRDQCMLSTTIKAAAAIGILAFAASQWVYSEADRIALARLTAQATAPFEPETTGTLMQSAQSARLDPCNGNPLH